MWIYLRKLLFDESGAALVEYALMLALIFSVCVGIVGLLGISSRDAINSLQVVWP
ncbi:MAG TPA: Flp family type IVb pilin [Armatimonadota bacterium]|jgi:Flp pilus assembly pilin Flp|nr:Flp family type IVb pilin [Armatimonadota bacterium]HOM72538.1 Flp family type IVb pilin [Armatimonadota bacterium]HPP75509.1 Flp family type IVb pilin [Armatimonadota bacterium]